MWRGCVTQTEIWSPKAKTPDFRIYFDLAEAKPGLWLPWRKDIVNLFTKNILRTIFENVKVNEPLEDESIFHVRFQPGTTVEDRVEKIVYRVGKGSSEERRDIRKFTAEQELALAKEAAEKPSSLWWPWLAGGLGLTLCVGLACYWWRYRGRAKVAGLLIGAIVNGVTSREVCGGGAATNGRSEIDCSRRVCCAARIVGRQEPASALGS